MWWKKNKWKVIVPAALLVVLAAAFWYGGGAPGLQGWTVRDTPAPSSSQPAQPSDAPAVSPQPSGDPDRTAEPAPSPDAEPSAAPSQEPETSSAPQPGDEPLPEPTASPAPAAEPSVPQPSMEIDPVTGKDRYQTDPVPSGRPLPVEPEDAEITDTAYTCTVSISCAAILAHMDWLDGEKTELVPEDGWILPPAETTFYEGESVFHVLRRVCKQQKIHMEFQNTPIYNSAYIEGIGNLYEFDCGEQSGWMYSVNGWFPNYGCSRYALQPGDRVEWVYTCELGADVGGTWAAGGEN